jgi:hypothetical protein
MIELTSSLLLVASALYGPVIFDDNSNLGSKFTNLGEMNTASVIESDIKIVDPVVMEKHLRKEFAETPLLIEIARCESNFKQFDKNGNIIRGIANKSDVGVMQINEKYHADTAKKLGIDLHTVDGNIRYAKKLYSQEGSKPWSASQGCWGKAENLLAKK